MKYEVMESRGAYPQTGLISDEAIGLIVYYISKKCPDNLRIVVYEDFMDDILYRFLTNNFTLEAITIAELYH